MNTIALGLMLAIWQADDSKFLDSIRAIPVIQHEQHDSGSAEIVDPPQVTIEFSDLVSSEPQLVRSQIKATTQERYLVSESWCAYCPAAKTRFLQSGGNPENVIDIATAKAMGHQWGGGVPHEFSRTVETTKEIIQPPKYRTQWPAKITLDGTSTPTKDAMLRHLRSGGPHADKHWQAWHLESWSREQLVALHEDDHNGTVPVYLAESDDTTANVSGGEASLDTVAEALALHLVRDVNPEALTGSLFNIEIDTPDSARGWIADMLTRQSVDFPAAGVSARWGGDRSMKIGRGSIAVTPGVDVSVKKFGVSVSTKLTGASFADDLSWVTLELDRAPDLTVRFK